MVASNSNDCFRACVGKKVRGVLFDSEGRKTLIFDDGSGLTFAPNGAFWVDSAKHINREIEKRRRELEETKGELAEVLSAAGT